MGLKRRGVGTQTQALNSGSRNRIGRISRFLFSLPLLLSVPVSPVQGQDGAQGTLLKARTEVDLTTFQDPIPVLSTFTLHPNRGAREIPLSLLSPEPTRLISLKAILDGREVESGKGEGPRFVLAQVREYYWEGSIQLPSEIPETRDSIILKISYMVDGGWGKDRKATIPLVIPRWAPFEPLPETFTASVAIPAGLTVTGSFPTSVTGKPDPGMPGTYELGLQGVPAMLILRTAIGKGSFLTLEGTLDLGVVLILLMMGAAGIRYLRRKNQ